MNWYEQDIQRLEKEALNLKYKPGMVFYGSSTITMWEDLYEDFRKYEPVNLGFGGSTLEACVYYFNRVMKYFNPQYIVVYAGDNDLGDGGQPKEVLVFFEQLCKLITEKFSTATLFYISIKPSPARWNINRQIKETNELIKRSIKTNHPQMQFINMYKHMLNEKGKPNAELYVEDGLHLSTKGYDVWKEVLLTYFSLNIHDK
jgi:lysophospholipase L1-like esterase